MCYGVATYRQYHVGDKIMVGNRVFTVISIEHLAIGGFFLKLKTV